MGVKDVEVQEGLRRKLEGWRDGNKGILLHGSPTAGKSFAVGALLPKPARQAQLPEVWSRALKTQSIAKYLSSSKRAISSINLKSKSNGCQRNKMPRDGQRLCGSNSLGLCVSWFNPTAPAELRLPRYGTHSGEARSLLVEALSHHFGN